MYVYLFLGRARVRVRACVRMHLLEGVELVDFRLVGCLDLVQLGEVIARLNLATARRLCSRARASVHVVVRMRLICELVLGSVRGRIDDGHNKGCVRLQRESDARGDRRHRR